MYSIFHSMSEAIFCMFSQMITLGGDAELELVDSLDPFSEGVVFSVRPPKKSWKNISNLSGGEKTLSSLALVSIQVNYIRFRFISKADSSYNCMRVNASDLGNIVFAYTTDLTMTVYSFVNVS